MTRLEFSKIASAIKCAYPSANVLPDTNAINLWYTMLEDLDYGVCQNAVMQIISTSKYPPTIAEIREKSAGLTSKPIMDWGEAWEGTDGNKEVWVYAGVRSLR